MLTLCLGHIKVPPLDAYEEGSLEEFQEWLGSTHEGWLLLDSIDEARLRDPADFELAVRLLGLKLRTATQRLHLVLTGRTAAWRPLTDLELCTRHLPYSAPRRTASESESVDGENTAKTIPGQSSDTVRSTFTVVALDDLSVEHLRLFAHEMQISDVDDLLEAIERTDSWSFTSRPLDLQELLEFWQDKRRIGSRLELLRASIDKRLREQDQTRDELSPLTLDRAREGALLVAAACTLTQQQTIAVPDGARNIRGLQLDSLMPDWSAKERITLLQRPLFDEEIYASVRFHHRSTREYLTAEWFAGLLKNKTSRRAIEGLFFREQYGLHVVAPNLRSVLPWLAILDTKIQERALRIAPELLLGDGDPSQLHLKTRQQVLEATCAALAGGNPRSLTDYAAIQRFAAEDLTSDIQRLLSTYKDEESQVLLLRMIWKGRLVGALTQVLDVALSPSAAIYARRVACRAVGAVGSEADLSRIRLAFSQESDALNRDVLAELLEMAPKSKTTLAWLCDCLAKVADYRQYSADYLREGIREFVRQIDPQDLPLTIERFNRLLEEQPATERGDCEISNRNTWLAKPAALALQRLLQERDSYASSDACLSLLRKLAVAKQYDLLDSDSAQLELEPLIQGWSDLKFALFWHGVEVARRKAERKGERITDWWRAQTWPSYVVFASTDFDSALACVSSRVLADDRLVALSLAFHLYVELGRPEPLRRRLKAVCKGVAPLAERLQTYLHPPRQTPEAVRIRRMNEGWKRKSKARAESEKKNFDKARRYLADHIDSIRDPGLGGDNISQNQHYLHQRVRSEDKNMSTWASGNWRSLEADFGSEVARAYRDAAVAYWRRHRPELASEADTTSTSFSVIFGLAGLAIDSAETTDWATHLTEADVELSFRYAMRELNGFPSWFPAVFERSPTVVRDLTLTEVDHDLRSSTADKDPHYVIYDINWSGGWLWDLLAPGLLSRLLDAEPKNLRSLQHLLNVIQGSNTDDESIRALAQLRAMSSTNLGHSAQWYAVWTGVAPSEALPALLAHVDGLASGAERSTFVMMVLTQLIGGRRGEASRVRRSYCTAQHLKTLYLLAHRHVRVQEDIDRTGGRVYSPGLRDDAQDAREHLLSLLRALPGKDTFVALSEIATALADQAHGPYIAEYAKAKAVSDAAGAPWSEGQVRDFNEEQERTPSNHRELFDLAVLRILDLKDDLEEGDSSDAPMLAGVKSENHIRTYIGNWLRNFANQRYAAPQEEELSDGKRPDLRFLGNAFDAPVPVELKLADNWTGPTLFERLEVQLCGDYLRDLRSGCGIFLLVYRGEQQVWQLPDSTDLVSFDVLVEQLQARWVAISPSSTNVEEILVVGIDLTKRKLPLASPAPRKKRSNSKTRSQPPAPSS